MKVDSKYSGPESSDLSESDDEADQNSKLAAVDLIENEKRRQHKGEDEKEDQGQQAVRPSKSLHLQVQKN